MKIATVLLVLLCVGCFTMPTQEERLAGAEVLFQKTLDVLTKLVQDGVIEKSTVDPYVQAAYSALLDMRSSVVLGGDGWDEAWGAFSAAMGELNKARRGK